MREWRIQLKDLITGQSIITAGGKVYVATADSPAKQAIVNSAGASATNPMTPTRGFISFFVASEDVTSVDLYILAPGGQFVVAKGLTSGGPNEIVVDTGQRFQSFVIPYAIADTTAASETSTGFVIPAKSEMLPIGLGVDVVGTDATETIDVGTLSTDGGDANGFMDTVSVATGGFVKPSLLHGSDTMGALMSVVDSANAGDDAPEGDVSMQGKEITYTLTAGTDTATGFIHLPFYLAA